MDTVPKVLNNVSEQVLIALGRYKYLTISQMLKAGVGTVSVRYLRAQLKSLSKDRKRPLIGVIEYAPSGPKRGGRYEYMYYLRTYGKRMLSEQLGLADESIRMPVGHPQFYKLYHHRRMQIDFHIALYQWTQAEGFEISLFENDFDTVGGNRANKKLEARTKIFLPAHLKATKDFIIPDGAFVLQTSVGLKFFLLEVHRGDDVKRAVDQLYLHALAIGAGLPSAKYGINKGNRVLVVFEKGTTMHSVAKELSAHPAFSKLSNYFLLKMYDDLERQPFDQAWMNFNQEIVPLY